MYIKSLGVIATAVILMSFSSQLACDLGGNIWLSLWSQDMDSSSNHTMDPSERVGVYGGIGAVQSKQFSIFQIDNKEHFYVCKLQVKTFITNFTNLLKTKNET